MCRKICLYLLLLVPFLFCAIWLYIISNFGFDDAIFMSMIFYILSIVGIVYFVKIKPFNAWLLPISFILSPVPIFIYEHPGGGFLPFIGTGIVLMLYAIPFFLISVIVAIVLSVSAYKKGRDRSH